MNLQQAGIMESGKITNLIILLFLFAAFIAGLLLFSRFTGLLLIGALLMFGILSTVWHERILRLAALAALLILSLIAIYHSGMKFGIDFSGGTRIPVILESAVDQTTMNELVDTIKKRANVMGLTEVKVKAIGNSEIDVELPLSDESLIKSIEDVLAHQGVFQGIVDGKVALNGDDILPGTIMSLPAANLRGADWGVTFSVTKKGAEAFSEAVKGKANYPLYMFLDRPTDAVVFITMKDLRGELPDAVSDEEVVNAAKDALRLEGKDLPLYILSNDSKNITVEPMSNKTKAIISSNIPQDMKDRIAANGFTILEVDNNTMVPSYSVSQTGEHIIVKWEAIGLLSAPRLSPQVTEGIPSYAYSISGSASGQGAARVKNAQENVKRIESILKGGALPVQISIGSRTAIPAPLGQEFLKLSMIGIVISLVVISLFVAIRYRKLRFILPVIAISISELIILLSILGSFTIDLAAMAGILAAIGVGVDSQIVITDELLKKETGDMTDRFNHAIAIIKTTVTVSMFSMLPLLFSGLVEIIGFAISTMLGALLGYLLSRPAYAAIVEMIVEKED